MDVDIVTRWFFFIVRVTRVARARRREGGLDPVCENRRTDRRARTRRIAEPIRREGASLSRARASIDRTYVPTDRRVCASLSLSLSLCSHRPFVAMTTRTTPATTMVRESRRRRRAMASKPLRWWCLAVVVLASVVRVARGEEEESAAAHVIETYDANADEVLDADETSALVEAFARRTTSSGSGGGHEGHAHEEDEAHAHEEDETHEVMTSISSDDLVAEFGGADGTLNETEFLAAAAAVARCLAEPECAFIASRATPVAAKKTTKYTALKMGLMAAIFAMGFLGGMLPLAVTTRLSTFEGSTRYLNAFSGGLFLSAGFIHLLPHAIESASEAKIGTSRDYPFAMVMTVLGFCVAFCVERVLFHTHSHGTEDHGETHHHHDDHHDHHPHAHHDHDHKHHDHHDHKHHEHHDHKHHEHHAKVVVATVVVDPNDDCEKCDIEQSASMFTQTRSALVFMAGVALHASLAGVSLGTQTERKAIFSIFVAIASHKSAAAFSVGTQFLRCGVNDVKTMALFMLAFAAITPVGIVIGYFAESTSPAAAAVLEGISAGTFIYVGTIEVVGDEFENTIEKCDDDHGHNHKVATHEHNVHGAPPRPVRLAKFGAYMLGVTFIALVQLAIDHAH